MFLITEQIYLSNWFYSMRCSN